MKYFSMFSGIGGFEYGIERACDKQFTKIKQDRKGWYRSTDQTEPNVLPTGRVAPLCVGFSEIDKYAKQIYKKHFGGECENKSDRECRERTRSTECLRHNRGRSDSQGEPRKDNEDTITTNKGHKDYGDCTKIRWEEFEDFDTLVGGFPCQAFSIAGKRGGFDDTRGTLFFEIARCLREKQPRLCVLENVKGLLSHDKGQTFFTILTTLDELGYDVEWQVLNSKNFGVPQNRERVFIVGHLRGTGKGKVFPIAGTNEKNNKANVRTNSKVPQPEGDKPNSSNVIRRTSYTDGMRIRRLTPTECERLQGFPDGWTENRLTKVQLCGNIPYNYRRYICDRYVGLKTAIEKLYREKMGSAYYIIKDSEGMERQINVLHQKENANIVGEMRLHEISALDTINPGNDMVTLCNLKGTYKNESEIRKNLTQEKMERKCILPLWKICLEEKFNEERLSTILTSIKEITKSQIFTYVGTDEPITNVIIHWNLSQPNFTKEESFNLKMASIVSVSDTQRYKCLGNAVTTNVITAIFKQICGD